MNKVTLYGCDYNCLFCSHPCIETRQFEREFENFDVGINNPLQEQKIKISEAKKETKRLKPKLNTSHTIYYGDCRHGLKRIQNNSVHLIITSPPYNLNINYNTWNDRMNLYKYIDFCKEWLRECFRILINGGKLCINLPTLKHRNYYGTSLPFLFFNLMRKIGFRYVDMVAWVKSSDKEPKNFICKRKIYGTLSPFSMKLRNADEIVIIMSKGRNYLEGRVSDLDKLEFENIGYNVWFIRPEQDRTHPAPFPEELPKRLIKLYSYVSQTVLDIFLGSGTTMKVAQELNRNSIGCELDGKYIEMTKKRCNFPIKIEEVRIEKQITSYA